MIESSHDLPTQLDVGGLVLADGDEKWDAGFAVHYDIGGLQAGVAEEAIGVKIFVGYVFEGFIVRGDAFEPA